MARATRQNPRATRSDVTTATPSLQGNDMVRKMAYPTAVLNPAPTFTQSVAATLAVNKSPYWVGFRTFGSSLFTNGLGATTGYPRGPVAADGVTYSIWDGSWGIDFDFDEAEFEFRVQCGPTRYARVWADGVPHSLTPQATSDMVAGTASGSAYWIKVNFGSAKRRSIRLEFESTAQMIFSGVQHSATASMMPTSMASPRILFATDSQGHGIAPTAERGFKARSYPNIVAKLLGFADHWNATSVPSTGVVKQNLPQGNYRSRYASDVIPNKPDIVVIQNSLNDADSWPLYQGQVGPELKLGIDQLRAALPNVKIICVSPIKPATTSAALAAIRDETKAVCDAMGVPYIDALVTTAPVFLGTGSTASPQANGNADKYQASDFTHMNAAGHVFFAPWLASQLAPLLGQTG